MFSLGVMKMTLRKYTQIPVNSKPEGDMYNKNLADKYTAQFEYIWNKEKGL